MLINTVTVKGTPRTNQLCQRSQIYWKQLEAHFAAVNRKLLKTVIFKKTVNRENLDFIAIFLPEHN